MKLPFSLNQLAIGMVFVALIALIVIGITWPRHTAVPPVASASSSTATPHISSPSKPNEQSLPEFAISTEPRPITADVWRFEEAYNGLNPVSKTSQLQPYVTSQYLQANQSDDTDRSAGLNVLVDSNTSTVSFTCSSDALSCYVVTHVTLTSYRSGTAVRTYSVPAHATIWINTPDGWRVAQETEVRNK